MASAQQVQLSDNAKVKVGKAIEEAKNILANANIAKDQKLATVGGAVNNDQETTLELHSKHNYQGHFLGDPAQFIPKHDSASFLHQSPEFTIGPTPNGSKGAIIYSQYGVNNTVAPLGWLLAWYKPPVGLVGATSKVYVEAGKVERLDKIGWEEIENRLDKSIDISRFWDSETGAEASAKIENFSAYMSLVGAHFNINTDKN